MYKKIENHCKKILKEYDRESGCEFLPPQLNWAISAMIEYAEQAKENEREKCTKIMQKAMVLIIKNNLDYKMGFEYIEKELRGKK